MKKPLVALAALAALFAIACTPEEQAVWASLTPGQQAGILDSLRPAPTDCYGALSHFSGDHNRARKIIHRESRNNPSAANPRSSARGCFQLMHSVHAHRYTAVGCSPSQWSDPVCNVKAADHLYRAAGWSPWRATAY